MQCYVLLCTGSYVSLLPILIMLSTESATEKKLRCSIWEKLWGGGEASGNMSKEV